MPRTIATRYISFMSAGGMLFAPATPPRRTALIISEFLSLMTVSPITGIGPEAHEQALVFVALCVGGMVLARAIDDDDLGSGLRDTAQSHILTMAGWQNGPKHKSLHVTK